MFSIQHTGICPPSNIACLFSAIQMDINDDTFNQFYNNDEDDEADLEREEQAQEDEVS